MIKADLITGFLGSGKTTILKKYADHLLSRNIKLGIIENDYGAVNVDVMLLRELEQRGCMIESVAGACDRDCHMRRFKTKLIALAMYGCQRVIVEPSGLFDTDEFFDSLREDPLDRMYEAGSVIAVADAGLSSNMSPMSQYMLASQCANAGMIVLSKTDLYGNERAAEAIKLIKASLRELGAPDDIERRIVFGSELDAEGLTDLSGCGRRKADFVKKYRDIEGFSSLYFMNTGMTLEDVREKADRLLRDKSFGSVFRVKGFIPCGENWYEFNAAENTSEVNIVKTGQEIIIVIGEALQKDKIKEYFGGKSNA